MYELDQEYLKVLEDLAGELQESEELSKYLEEEEEEQYLRLKELYEPRISMVYEEVANKKPLQLIPLEIVLLDPVFEGLYLPKILGYSVLRGEIHEPTFKYVRPQDHFKEILVTICQSANFDILKKRIGQSIQIGFALSSDIWVTNLINSFENKRIRHYLQGQQLERYRRKSERKTGYERYKRQFRNDNYMTAEFPETFNELKVLFSPLKKFLIYRIDLPEVDNSSLIEPLSAFVQNESFQGAREHMEIMGLYAFFFELPEKDRQLLSGTLNQLRQSTPDFDSEFLEFILELHNRKDLDLTPESDLRMYGILDFTIDDDLGDYFELVEVVHNKGFDDEEAQDAVRVFYNQYEGLSVINDCLRHTIFQYFARFINQLEVHQYTQFFEFSKLFTVYMGIFNNQQFNQDLKEVSMAYIHRLLKHFTDKRGKDYQDIKKFVSTTFQDLGFLKEKEVVELFKTRRKKKKTAQ